MPRHTSLPLLTGKTLLGWLLAATPGAAELCSLDAEPAATLLVPYFEVDLDNPDGVTTLFSINNAEGSPALAHVVFWTDWSYPTLAFDVYLTGYDVVSVNVRHVFEGEIPFTADASSDPGQADPSLPCGSASRCGGRRARNRHWDDSTPGLAGEQGFPFCDQVFPMYGDPLLVGEARERLALAHTGRKVPSLNACVGRDHADHVARGYVARGYVTVDSVSECSLTLGPTDTGLGGRPYFVNGGLGVANNRNRLWGDWSLVDPSNNFAQGNTLAHVEAHDELDAGRIPLIHPATGATAILVDQVTRRTFYGRFFQDADGRDNREPLPTIWGARYVHGSTFDGTQLVVWRDPNAVDPVPVPDGEPGSWCESGPAWFPLNEAEVLIFNESEDAVEICSYVPPIIFPPYDDPECFPQTTGRYELGTSGLSIPFDFGWTYLNLATAVYGVAPGVDEISQSHVTTLHQALGLYSVGLQAVELHNACEPVVDRLNGAAENGGVNLLPPF